MAATEHIQSLSREPGRFRVAVVLGTRPEAIKLAPVVRACGLPRPSRARKGTR